MKPDVQHRALLYLAIFLRVHSKPDPCLDSLIYLSKYHQHHGNPLYLNENILRDTFESEVSFNN